MGNTLSFITELARIVAMSEFDSSGKHALQRLLAQVQTLQDLRTLKHFLAYAHQHQKHWEDIALQQFLLDEDLPQSTKQQFKNMVGSTTDDDCIQNSEHIELEILSCNRLFKKVCLDVDNSKIRVENVPSEELTVRLSSGLVLWQERLENQNILFDSDSQNLKMAADTGSEGFPERSVEIGDGRLLLEIYATGNHYALDLEIIK